MSIRCPLYFCDDIVDPYAPRETFLDDNPELKLNMKWDPKTMDEYAATVFRNVGLDREEYKEFTEYELEALEENGYWMSIPDFSKRIGYENTLMQGLALALIALCPRMERLCIWRHDDEGEMSHFESTINVLVNDEATREKILTRLTKLEFRSELKLSRESEYLTELFQIPAVKSLVAQGVKTKEKRLESWEIKTVTKT
ncbi:hypothetical protein ABW20_dc0105567 [Dactylellina cionopaga]|nr:hypothetical protein ABW20_dc0105567 [Dactylellina cionopaga]